MYVTDMLLVITSYDLVHIREVSEHVTSLTNQRAASVGREPEHEAAGVYHTGFRTCDL